MSSRHARRLFFSLQCLSSVVQAWAALPRRSLNYEPGSRRAAPDAHSVRGRRVRDGHVAFHRQFRGCRALRRSLRMPMGRSL